MALIAFMLVFALHRLGQRVCPRPYMDDLTTSIRGAEDAATLVHRSWQIVGEFGRIFRWEAAVGKCARVSTSRAVCEEPRAVPGPPVCDSCPDLGTVQPTTAHGDPRPGIVCDIKALMKLSRMQALRVSFAWRGRFVSGSGVPTALHGVESQAVTVGR